MKLINQGKTVIHTPGNHDLLSTIYSLFGKETAHLVIPLDSSYDGINISGYVGKPEISRGNRNLEFVFVNGRSIYNKTIIAAIEQAYKTKLMQKRFPFTVLKLDIAPQLVDVNVHPAKLEVRFSDEQQVFRAVHFTVSSALSGASLIQNVEDDESPRKDDLEDKNLQVNNFGTGENALRLEIPSESAQTFKYDKSHNSSYYATQATEKNQQQNHYNLSETAQKNETTQNEIFENISKASYLDSPQSHVAQTNTYERSNVWVHQKGAQSKGIPNQSDEALNEYVEGPKQADMEPSDEVFEVPQNTFTASASSEQDNDKERLLNARIAGQAFESYIILEHRDDMFLIDQHAAHERIRYEKIRKQFTQSKSFSQGLLTPLAVELTEFEMQKFNELDDYISRLGFEVEDFGNRTILVRAIPYIMSSDFSSRDFRDILERLSREVHSVSEIIPEETIYIMACKSAIKANKHMSTMEIEGLVKELINTENPYTCVHGRPIIISINKRELEKKFKRIV